MFYRYLLLSLLLFVTTLQAKEPWPELSSAGGASTIHAMPVQLAGDDIRFKKSDGTSFTSSIKKFSENDQKKLTEWRNLMHKNLHQQLVARVRSSENLKVLFIGNSYSFRVPIVFEKLALKNGKKLTVEQVTKGGITLARHSKSKQTLEKIKSGGYDVVILQEQSQVPAFGEAQRHQTMDEAAKTLVEAVKDSGAIPVFFQTWGRKNGDKQNAAAYPNDTYEAMQERLKTGYANAAKFSGGVHIVPVGELWGKLISKNKAEGAKLYTKDGSHPSRAGVAYTAAAFYSALYDEPADKAKLSLTDTARPIPVPYK